jgi:hypothetical protein
MQREECRKWLRRSGLRRFDAIRCDLLKTRNNVLFSDVLASE